MRIEVIQYSTLGELAESFPVFYVGSASPYTAYVVSTTAERIYQCNVGATDESAFVADIKPSAISVDSYSDAIAISEYIHTRGRGKAVNASGQTEVRSTPSSLGMRTWFTTHDDEDSQIKVEFAGGETGGSLTQWFECVFGAPIEIHDGNAIIASGTFTWDDQLLVQIVIPENSATSTPGAGNVNAGTCSTLGLPIWVPAPEGDGTHTIDLGAVAPFPVEHRGIGYWEVDRRSGVITAGRLPGHEDFHVLRGQAVTLQPVRKYIGTRAEVPAGSEGAEWLHQTWTLKLGVRRVSSPSAAKVLFELEAYREDTSI